MNIGIFDSGLGGLAILKAVREKLPQYNYIYLGDSKNLPYGDRSQKQIFELTRKAVAYLFENNCQLVILACNTASSQALRKIQQDWLPKSIYKNRRVLGIIRPTVESVKNFKNIGIVGTRRTIDSKAYNRELANIGWRGKLKLKATPKLVPAIEAGESVEQILPDYLKDFKNLDALILACTHYDIIKLKAEKLLGRKTKIISQGRVLPAKLKDYLKRHKEIPQKLGRSGKIQLLVTKLNPHYKKLTQDWFGKRARLKVINY